LEAGAAALVEPVIAFGRELRAREIEIGPGRVEAAIRALGCVDARDPDETYWAMRCAMLSRIEDADAFDAAFAAFWRGSPMPGMRLEQPLAPREDLERRDQDPAATEGASFGSDTSSVALEAESDEDAEEHEADPVGVSFSPVERLREMDFSDWGPEELAQARPLIRRIAQALPQRRSRRLRASNRGAAIDRRATMRRAMRTEGHPLDLLYRERRVVPRRMVFLIDVSGSMELYARPVIVFAQAVRQASTRLEAFAFGTRLTRLTRQLGGRDPAQAMERASRAVPDWAGGTRIGENLRVLNANWGRRGITRGATVVIFSDGWERGDASQLSREMGRLHRSAHLVVWVNPLAGEPGYEPLAAGMAAALPHVDRFLPGHDLRSLEALVEVLDEAQRDPMRSHGENPPARIR
jgi:uncharacterized protein with von Willebrand factor type A (vWA) domain